MASGKKTADFWFSLSLILFIISSTSLDFEDFSYENNKLQYLILIISVILILIAFFKYLNNSKRL